MNNTTKVINYINNHAKDSYDFMVINKGSRTDINIASKTNRGNTFAVTIWNNNLITEQFLKDTVNKLDNYDKFVEYTTKKLN